MRLPETLLLQADALAAGRITGPVQLWRMGLALRAAADHDRVRHGLPRTAHRVMVTVCRALLGARSGPSADQAVDLAASFTWMADEIDRWAAGPPPDPSPPPARSCRFARRAA
jgi:hypothetical protein